MTAAWLEERLSTLAGALDAEGHSRDELSTAIVEAGRRGAYLALGVLSGRVPTEGAVTAAAREFARDGARAFDSVLRASRRAGWGRRSPRVDIESGVVVDLTNTAQSGFTTGIQRVARELVKSWSRAGEELHPVVWTRTGELRRASPTERQRAGLPEASIAPALLIPDRARLVLPEIAVDPDRAQRLASIALFGSRTSLAIGFDCIPVTTAETAGPGMPGAFSRYLAGLARFDRIVAISGAARTEFVGWSEMLPSAGLVPPTVDQVDLPITPIDIDPEPEGQLRASLDVGSLPVVLAVGSHEPRKNHLAILGAAELAWQQGHEFALVFVGGNAWNSGAFTAMADRLTARGRAIRLLRNAPDETVAGLYALATFSIFCSVNEGYGLPVAESLAVGTPVITADFGSQRDIGAGRGAVLVSPKDMLAMSSRIVELLTSSTARDRLVVESRTITVSSWAAYGVAVRNLLGD